MWSKKHSECITCGTTEKKHVGKGMCRNCYNKKYREENIKKEKKGNKIL